MLQYSKRALPPLLIHVRPEEKNCIHVFEPVADHVEKYTRRYVRMVRELGPTLAQSAQEMKEVTIR